MARTRLTVAPGQPLALEQLGRGDRYSPGLKLPAEPTWPGRLRRVWLIAAMGLIVVAGVTGFLLLNERGNSFDPALDPERFGPSEPVPAPASESPLLGG